LPEGIEAGCTVKAGDKIGYVGDTAMAELADESHLHFEMTVGGIQVDPLDYFGEDAVATLAQDNSYEDPQ
jgi:murein DD-endopeptidase MepM/ murein hydrolase activator NlpD